MKSGSICPQCLLVFSRKWNLQRHLKLMHGINVPTRGVNDRILKNTLIYEPKPYNPQPNLPSSSFKESFKEVFEFEELRDKVANSNRTFELLNALECQVNNLRQLVASQEKRFSDLISYNLFFPKGAIQGISGYVCKKCRTFSLKPILDPGYDMTMENKHLCTERADKRSYFVFPIPSDIRNVDDWSAQCLLNQINSYIPIGKNLIASEITDRFNNLSSKWSRQIAMEFLGIPDKYYCYSFQNNYKPNWIDRAIGNLDKRIAMKDEEILDFFRKVKSTYAVFEIPQGDIVRQFFMFLTNF